MCVNNRDLGKDTQSVGSIGGASNLAANLSFQETEGPKSAEL